MYEFNFRVSYMVSAVIPILQMRKLRQKLEVKSSL